MGISGALRRDELVRMTLEDIQEDKTVLIVTVPDTKTDQKRVFTITNQDYIRIYYKYVTLRPKRTAIRRLFLRYENGKCSAQVVGVHTIGKIPSMIAKYLGLPNSEAYTGHSFRRSSATLLANTGADISVLKRHGGWKSTTVAEGYVEDSIHNKNKISDAISGTVASSSNVVNRKMLMSKENNTFLSNVNNDCSETIDLVASSSGMNISNNINSTINVNIYQK